MNKFALIGAAGYIAPRHMNAMKKLGHDLVAVLDPNDSIGIIDSYFPHSKFFTEFERFSRHLDLLKGKTKSPLDYVSITSPNYLHDAHISFALRSGADAICEKPLVLDPNHIDLLKDVEKETGKKVWNILQLRLHPSIVELKTHVEKNQIDKKYDVDLTYITSRGSWYLSSWKGQTKLSGGIAFNIGIHFFDMLSYIFGDMQKNILHMNKATKAAGYLEYENARVRWFLSIDENDLPLDMKKQGQRTYRCICVDGKELEFSKGFTDLHTASYDAIEKGQGFSLDQARNCVETAYEICHLKETTLKGDYHPYLKTLKKSEL